MPSDDGSEAILRELAGDHPAVFAELIRLRDLKREEHSALVSQLESGELDSREYAHRTNASMVVWVAAIAEVVGAKNTEDFFGVSLGDSIVLIDPDLMASAEPRSAPPMSDASGFDVAKFRALAKLNDRYERQLTRLRANGIATGAIESTVAETLQNLDMPGTSALVIYGEPQSGKTEMMICLTGKLLDSARPVIVHLMNDSVDLLSQNLRRFKDSGLAPAAKTLADLPVAPDPLPSELVLFCKKNSQDLEKLTARLGAANVGPIVVIDDEADFATPNRKVNRGEVTAINGLIGSLLASGGTYIGVTATPARLDLNNTFQNQTERWVQFLPHQNYTGQDTFFPLDPSTRQYRLTFLGTAGPEGETRSAFVRFLVTVGYLNTYEAPASNWTMLVHTSGKKADHKNDQRFIERLVATLLDTTTETFELLVREVFATAKKLYPDADADVITTYVVQNASRAALTVLNSNRERKGVGDNAMAPSSPFTIIIGGNIVSRGVTFPNLLSMFFTRDVKQRLQQDTYIQRARMFGARGAYLKHFELTIPARLFADWRRCFVFHRLALKTIQATRGAPVWIGDRRIAVASSTSIDRTTVVLDKGEMSFHIFPYDAGLDDIVKLDNKSVDTLLRLRERIGDDALPAYLTDYIRTISAGVGGGGIAIHPASSIANYRGQDVDHANIRRRRGFIGTTQLEHAKFPGAHHHIKILYNADGQARVFYKYTQDVVFIHNER